MKKEQQKIVFFGGPGTGKTTVINQLKKQGFLCMDEISRAITAQAQKDGISQLFLEDPLLFSKKLLEGREQQFLKASEQQASLVFFDRGIPEVFGYLNYIKTPFPKVFTVKSEAYRYHKVLHFPIWKDIYTKDEERYESLEEAMNIENHLINAYRSLNYKIVTVPYGTPEERTSYILNLIE